MPFWSAYAVSKAGLDILTECLRYELDSQGIAVVLVKPAPIATPIWRTGSARSEALLSGMPAEAQALYGAFLDKVSEAGSLTAACGATCWLQLPRLIEEL